MDEPLLIVPVPALVAVLLNREKAKGPPLTREEVEAIRDQVESVAVPASAKKKLDEARGYDDIDPEFAWEQWQQARVQLGQTP